RPDEWCPGAPLDLGRRGVTVARQIHDATLAAEVEEIHEPRPTRSAAHAREPMPLEDGVDRARLAHVRATGEGDLRSMVGWKLRRLRGAHEKLHVREEAHETLTVCGAVRRARTMG